MRAYQAALRELGYKVIKEGPLVRGRVRHPLRQGHNADPTAVDLLLQSQNPFDRVVLVTGDGDSCRWCGRCRTSRLPGRGHWSTGVSAVILRSEADLYVSGLPDPRPAAGPAARIPPACRGARSLARARGYRYHHGEEQQELRLPCALLVRSSRAYPSDRPSQAIPDSAVIARRAAMVPTCLTASSVTAPAVARHTAVQPEFTLAHG